MSEPSVSSSVMRMSDRVWARHANPWSVWTRVPILPLIALSVWARAWVGWWCLVPIAVLAIWSYANPRAFPPPRRTDRWSSRATFGERVWIARKAVGVPPHHVHAARMLMGVSAVGLIPMAWGLWRFDAAAVCLGLAITVGAKLWFLDRMVWLYEDMKPRHKPYAAWEYTPADSEEMAG